PPLVMYSLLLTLPPPPHPPLSPYTTLFRSPTDPCNPDRWSTLQGSVPVRQYRADQLGQVNRSERIHQVCLVRYRRHLARTAGSRQLCTSHRCRRPAHP